MQVRLTNIRYQADGIASFELTPVNGEDISPFLAGSNLDIHIRPGLIRQYSLTNAPDDLSAYRIAVQREESGRGGSKAMHDELRIGQVLEVGEPRNQFCLDPAAKHHVLMAGGIGITPLLAMARACIAAGHSFEMHYTARSPDKIAFRKALRSEIPKDTLTIYNDAAKGDARFDLAAHLPAFNKGSHMYICGPGGFMDATIAQAAGTGWPDDTVHIERFAGDAPVQLDSDGEFFVVLKKSGTRVAVAEDQTILEALDNAGIDVDFSCEQGICGTCITKVLSGRPDHRDSFLNDAEKASNQMIAVCVSRCIDEELILDM